MKTLKQIMTEAHQIARTFEGNYSACLSEALRVSHKNAKENFTPDFIRIENSNLDESSVKEIFNILKWSVNSEMLIDEILMTVKNNSNGFQKDIAEKAQRGISLSQKQAWCVAYEYKKVA